MGSALAVLTVLRLVAIKPHGFARVATAILATGCLSSAPSKAETRPGALAFKNATLNESGGAMRHLLKAMRNEASASDATTFANADASKPGTVVRSEWRGLEKIADGATAVPYFDVEAYCSTHKECIIVEQQAYDALRIEWPELTEEERQKIIFAASRSNSMKYAVAEARARGFIELHEVYRPAPKFQY